MPDFNVTPIPEFAWPPEHPDNRAVDAFALAMKRKLADARERGRGGWDDPERCTVGYLAQLMVEQVTRVDADPVDIANFALFLHSRPGGTEALHAEIRQARQIIDQPDA